MEQPIHVLHVDDDPDVTELVATALEREDDRLLVETATGVAEGLDRLTNATDCIVADYEIAGRTGIEFLEAARDRYPDLPFILFIGKGSEEVASEAISAGVTDYLQKQGGLGQYAVLANRIANAVEQYRSKRALEDSQRRLSLFVEQSPLGVIEWDEAFDVAAVNGAAEDILGYDAGDLIGASWELIVPESNREAVGEVVDALVDDSGGYRSVNENVRADGERIVCEWYNHVVTDDDSVERSSTSNRPQADDGGVVAIFSQFRDVTDRIERERRLERNRARLEALFENSPDMINVHDIDGTIVEPNPRLCEQLGYDASELTGRKVWEIDETAEPGAVRRVWRGMEAGDRRRLEGVYRRRDGSTFPVEVHVQRVDLDDEARFVVVSREISERKARERELERYETIVETIDDVAMVVDGDRTVAYVNETGLEYAGSAAADIVGERIVALAERFVAEPGGVDRFERALERAFDATPPVDEPMRLELDVKSDVGDVVFEYQFSPVFDDGDPSAVVVTVRDVTERIERERALEATKERLATVISNVPVVLFALDAEGRFTLSEGRGLKALGLEPGDVVGESAFDLYAGNPDVLDPIRRALDGEEVTAVQEVADRFFETAYQPLVDDGTVTGVIGVAVDITERRRQADRLRRQNERLAEFAGVVSHDLQNPLNVAEGRIELARQEYDSDHLDDAASALDRMDELIRDLLQLAREGERVNDVQPVALATTIERCWDNVATGDAKLVVETDRTIRADAGRLQHLLENLVKNAVEHRSTGSQPQSDDAVEHGSTGSQPQSDDAVEHGATNADVTVTVGTLDDGFYVADDGPGIPNSERAAVFESGYSTTPDGTGFGLAIVEEVVEAHGWSIRATESETGGARFEITGVDIVDGEADR
jgi:PAS domain S-box-containing protein